MNRLAFSIFIALLTFTIGTGAAFYYLSQHSKSGLHAHKAKPLSEKLEPPRSFGEFHYWGRNWVTTTVDCRPIYFYTAPDGSTVTIYSRATKNPSLEGLLEKAEQVLEHTPISYQQGNQVGERAVVLNYPNSVAYPVSSTPVMLVWTEQGYLFEVCGETIQNVLAFEKAFKESTYVAFGQ